jgi:hypothetical protein
MSWSQFDPGKTTTPHFTSAHPSVALDPSIAIE